MSAPTDTKAPAVEGDGTYEGGLCPADGCPASHVSAVTYAVTCERCEAMGCDDCIVDDGDGYICDDCRTADAHREATP